ncbi:hypothetical protein L228DRAFT_243618 [Xylona heveae TC161]|uniref:Uncharacterized protein n=1 Tax=Xylona heveae (strain CBS 132557 / TC161) TaxID=1328760 RepID=A0A165IGX3_XYLHT|nr:hypothetical protein L228DRAFT_243618 [Xylona heveae TC161]KZF24879.1 hypothetical protein L228DRAFT_243618 [Xylona heveae TC161]
MTDYEKDDEMYDEDEDADEEEADPEEYEDNLEDEEEDDDKDDVEGNREREPRTIFFKGGSRLHLETSVPGSFPGTLTGVAQLMTGTECDFSFHEPQLYLTQNYHYAKHMADYARCRIDRVRQITIDSGRLNGHDIFGFANMLGTARGAGILHIEIPTRFIKDRIKDIRGTLWQKYVFFCRKRFSVLGSFPEQLYAAPILRGPILAVNNHVARRFSFDPENVVPFRMRRAENRWGVRSSGRSASTRGGEEGEELLRVGEFMRLSNESRRSRENGDFSEMWRLSNLADAMLDDGGSMTQGNYGRLDGMEGDIVLQTSFKRKMALENERHWVFKYEGLEE